MHNNVFFQKSNYKAALDITMLIGDTRDPQSLELPRAGVIRQGHQVHVKPINWLLSRCLNLIGQHRQLD